MTENDTRNGTEYECECGETFVDEDDNIIGFDALWDHMDEFHDGTGSFAAVTDDEDVEREKPCGNYHPLPCGLDKACTVPFEYYDIDLTDTEVVEAHARDVDAWNEGAPD